MRVPTAKFSMGCGAFGGVIGISSYCAASGRSITPERAWMIVALTLVGLALVCWDVRWRRNPVDPN